MKTNRHILADQKGAYFLMSAIVLSVMIGFAALGVEIGRWYGIQAEISKSIDGAAFAGAKNVSNPKFSDEDGNPDEAALAAFVQEVADANFPPGLLGTDTPVFTVTQPGNGRVQVNGTVNSLNTLTTVFDTGTHTTELGADGAAQLRRAEVALILDISGSMGPPHSNAIDDLITGAHGFVSNFQSFQKEHQFALITFATGVQTLFPLGTDFADSMKDSITDLEAGGATNTEDAMGRAVNLPWTPDQASEPANTRIRQVAILFSDGNPTAYSGQFKTEGGSDQTAVGLQYSSGDVGDGLGDSYEQHEWLPGAFQGKIHLSGDGKSTSSTACQYSGSGVATTKWYVMDDSKYGVNAPGSPIAGTYSAPYCFLPRLAGEAFATYQTWVFEQMAIDHATQLKAIGVELYTIGLGDIDEEFLTTLATDTDHTFFTNDPNDLEGIFQEIANKLKLILVS